MLTTLQKEGLGWLQEAGIAAILDHHALPGVAADSQMFAGKYVYTPIPEKPQVHFHTLVAPQMSSST